MTLQKFDYGNSTYERPVQNWICGRSATGEPCRFGPDSKGKCGAVAECQPRRDGDRWVCTRSNAAGGPCECGPMSDGTCSRPIPPCVPIRSIRAKRGFTVRWTIIATIGLLAILFGAGGWTLMMPGPLSRAHASLGNCHDCHTTVADGAFGWLHAAFVPASAVNDSAKCLSCHMVGKHALQPHGVALAELAVLTKRIAAQTGKHPVPWADGLRKAMFPVEPRVEAKLPCATCHVEHQGEKFNLAAVSDSICQACHVVQFTSFASGHPEFDHYPYQQRTHLIFDHVSHFGRHFQEAAKQGIKAPTACADCHTLGPDGQRMATKSFDQTCSACHLSEIVGADRAIGPRGLPFLSVPGLDLETLREHNIGIGQWPKYSDARITPIMKLLLSADPSARAGLAVAAKFDLEDLTKASNADLAAVGKLAWAIKKLYFELSTAGLAKFKARLAAATGRKVNDALIGRLTAAMPRDVLLGARRAWLPDLTAELAKHAAGKMVPIPGGKPPAPTPAPASSGNGGGAKDHGDILGGKDQGDILSGAPPAKDQGDILTGAPPAKDQGDILSGAPPAKDQGDILSGAPPAKDQGDILTGAPPPAAATATAAPSPPKEPTVNPEKFASFGGWYRQDDQILFYPTGHADAFLKAWLDYTGSIYGTPDQHFAEPVFKQLTAKDAQGQCTKCHSIERQPDGRLMVEWYPAQPTSERGFTHFSHAPHMRVSTDKGCVTCHQLDPSAKYLDAFKQTDPHHFASNFKPMSRTICAKCHTEQAAGDNCLTCHNYHAVPIETPVLGTRISVATEAPSAPKPSGSK